MAIGKPADDRNKVFSLLTGLGPGYESFVTTMLKPRAPSYNEVVPLLQSHETIKNMHASESYTMTNHNVAFVGQRQEGNTNFNRKGRQQQGTFTFKGCGSAQADQSFSRKEDFNNNNQGRDLHKSGPNQQSLRSASERGAICQICNKPNHTALRCWHRFNQTYQSNDIPKPWQHYPFLITMITRGSRTPVQVRT